MAGIILENIETLRYYQIIEGKNSNTVESIVQYVINAVTNLPWYFYLPIRMFAYVIGLFCLGATGRKLNLLSSEKRNSFLRRVQFIPLFSMLNKLVRSMAFLRLFDISASITKNYQ